MQSIDIGLYLKYLPLALPNIIVAFVTLNIGLYILAKGAKTALSRTIAFIQIAFGSYSFFGILLSLPVTLQLHIIAFKIHFIFIFCGFLSMYYASILFRESIGHKLKFQRFLFGAFFIPAFVLLTGIVLFTDKFYNFSGAIMNYKDIFEQGITTWNLPVANEVIILVIFECLITAFFLFNCFIAWINGPKEKYFKNRSFLIFISSLIAAVGIFFGVIGNYLSDMKIIQGDTIRFALYNFAVLISSIILSFAMVEYNAFIEEGRQVFNDFASTVLSFLIWTFLYTTAYIFLLANTELRDNIGILIALFIVAPTIAHHFDKGLRTMLFDLFERKKLQIPLITDEEINYALKNLMNFKKLEKSNLTRLRVVQLRKKKKNISSQEALKEIMIESIENFKLHGSGNNRTRVALKYEILQMIGIKQALESQILWCLGFECNSRINTDEPPKYEVKSNSEYTATSIMSYRRLKKEVINELRWKLTEMEEVCG